MELCYKVIYNPGLRPYASVPATINHREEAKPEPEPDSVTSEPTEGISIYVVVSV